MTTGGGRPPRKGSGPKRRGGGPKQRGGSPSKRGAPPKQQRRRQFPSVQITVACDDADLDRLTSKYRVLELESTAGAPLTERTLRNLVDRTPDGFQIHVRAHRLLTQQATPIEALWVDVRDKLSPALRAKPIVFPNELPPTVLDAALDRFVATLAPLHEFGKLGAIVFQFPSYFTPSSESLDYLVWLRERCGDMRIAVELRRRDWVNTKHREETFAFLEEHKITYVCVDAPQGVDTSVPPLAVATTDLAIVRLHGRNLEAWERNVDDPMARMRYEYRRADLEPWVARLEKLATGGQAVHAILTTAPPDSAGRSASLLVKVLTEHPDDKPPPEPPPAPPPKRRRF